MNDSNPTSGNKTDFSTGTRRALLQGAPAGLITALASGSIAQGAAFTPESECDRLFADWKQALEAFEGEHRDQDGDAPFYIAVDDAAYRLIAAPTRSPSDLAKKIVAFTWGEVDGMALGGDLQAEIEALANWRAM